MTIPNRAAPERLRDYLERMLRLLEERDEVNEMISDLKTELKAVGFDPDAFAKIVKEKRESETARAKRHATEAIADVYRAALGMLDGTPLGDAARKRLSQPADRDDEQAELPAPAAPEKPVDRAAAREEGRQAFRDRKRIIDNPYHSDDPRRAAWDEGWCLESGSDGMDIPAAWRRKKAEGGKADKGPGTPPGAPTEGDDGAGGADGTGAGEDAQQPAEG